MGKGAVGVKMPYLRVVGLAIDTEGAGRSSSNTVITAEEEESFRMLAQKPDVYETNCNSIFPMLYPADMDSKTKILLILKPVNTHLHPQPVQEKSIGDE